MLLIIDVHESNDLVGVESVTVFRVVGVHLLTVFVVILVDVFFFSSRRRHTRCLSDWSSDVCSSDLLKALEFVKGGIVGQIHSVSLERAHEGLEPIGHSLNIKRQHLIPDALGLLLGGVALLDGGGSRPTDQNSARNKQTLNRLC